MMDSQMKLSKALSQGSEASLIVLTAHFYGASPIKLKNLDYFHVQQTCHSLYPY